MRLASFLCLGGQEITNLARVTTYGACEFFDAPCPCPALDSDTFVSPEADPAPWYDADHPESADFLGLLTSSVELSPVASRPVATLATDGSLVGCEKLRGRVVEVTGWMVARNTAAMWWGERWLTEALRGPICPGCVTDTLQVLPFCWESDEIGYTYDEDFRTLHSVALVDGPRFVELSDDPNFVVNTVQFQFTAEMPWLYLPPTRCLEDDPITGTISCLHTTPDWMDGTFVIDITAQTAVTDLVITGRVSLDGDCPVGTPGDSVMPCFTYRIGEMAADDRILIDGTRRQALYYDASDKFGTSLLPHLDFTGPFVWPDSNPCTSLCLTIEVASGDATATVDGYLREL